MIRVIWKMKEKDREKKKKWWEERSGKKKEVKIIKGLFRISRKV